MAFPLSSPPAGFAVCSFPNNRAGIFYATEETPVVTLNTSVNCTYTVRDYFGNVVSTGNAVGLTVTPTAPAGGWNPGWYRFYLDGTTVDPVYGTSLGATNFIVIRDDSRFPARPALGYGTGKTSGRGGGEAQDDVTKGLLGMGSPSRRQISDASNPGATGIDNVTQATNVSPYIQEFWSNPTHTAYLDAERPRNQWIQFPNRTFDRIDINNGGFSRIYCKDATIDGTTVFVEMTGSTGNWTVNIYSPDSTTLVESYTGLVSGQDLENQTATSNYVRAFHAGTGGVLLSPKAIGNTFFNGTKSSVASLYTAGYTRFEGPINEGAMGPELAQRMLLFQAAVHAGNASAKAIGPCVVQIDNAGLNGIQSWDAFLLAGGGAYCDEISTHAYNSVTNGNLAQGRVILDAWQAKLAQYGQDTKPRWISESTQVFTSVYGVLHPRRARVVMMEILLMEQYKIPREQNLIWYDQSHGFWGQPDFVLNSDNSLQPFAALCRVLAEETFGFPYSSKLDFGTTTANAMFLGNVYKTASGGVVTLISASHIDNATVTLAVSGTSGPLTVVDGFGNTSTVTITGGHAVIPVDDIPTYVRLPAGATATVYSVLDWPPSQQDSISTQATSYTVGGTSAPAIADGGWITNYGAQTGIYISPNALPEDAIISFPGAKMVGGVVIFCGAAWQNDSVLVDFDVMTTNDGTTWTTQKTVTKTTPSSFTHGCDGNNSGCKQETYWDEQWIFPVRFDMPVSASGVKIHVRAASYGGEPDAAAIAAGGQGASAPHIALQEIAVLPGNSAYTYQWTRSGVNIAGATSSTYTTVSADAGHAIGCTVTATTDGGSNSANSNTLSIVTPALQQIGIPILP